MLIEATRDDFLTASNGESLPGPRSSLETCETRSRYIFTENAYGNWLEYSRRGNGLDTKAARVGQKKSAPVKFPIESSFDFFLPLFFFILTKLSTRSLLFYKSLASRKGFTRGSTFTRLRFRNSPLLPYFTGAIYYSSTRFPQLFPPSSPVASISAHRCDASRATDDINSRRCEPYRGSDRSKNKQSRQSKYADVGAAE